MNLRNYFDQHTGTGVLATADAAGMVNTALYARPHVLANDQIAFVMRERLSRHNLLENPHASYLFKEEGKAGEGVRLRLTRMEEFTEHALLSSPSRRPGSGENDENRYFVTFRVERCFTLVGGNEIPLS